MNAVKDRLVDEKLEDRMAAIAQREEIAAIRWDWSRKGTPHRLPTPYGELKVRPYFPGCWVVTRDSEPLVLRDGTLEAVFTSAAGAKAAGLVHLADGFGETPPYNDDLRWNFERRMPEYSLVQSPPHFPTDLSIPDDHERGLKELDRLLRTSDPSVAAADENLVLDLESAARSWQVPPPRWIKRAHGCFELTTPYGVFIVRRLVGWTVELNGAPLVWCLCDKKVIFDKLEHAKISALVHARDSYDGHFAVRWNPMGRTR